MKLLDTFMLGRWVRYALLLALHTVAAAEERATLWWQTGRWALADWLEAALHALPAVPGWAPAAAAWARLAAPGPSPRCSQAVAAVGDGVYLFGGAVYG